MRKSVCEGVKDYAFAFAFCIVNRNFEYINLVHWLQIVFA